MATKKKFKLKKKFRRLLLLLVILIVGVFFGINRYNLYKYHQTFEYKLLETGYEKDVVADILSKLNDKQVENILKEEKIDYLDEILKQKYFIAKNFDKYMSFYEENSKYDFKDVIALVNVGADKEWYEGTESADTSKGLLLLANKFHLLPEDYDPGEIKKFTASYSYDNASANIDCYSAFIEMSDDARKEGFTLIVTSGYRTYQRQEELYNDYLKARGEEYADGIAARPGASEHQTGYALDVFVPGSTMDMFHTTDAYTWLLEHAHEYGFIQRYPEGKKYITGYDFESWHYRYVGKEMAEKIKGEGITYDEYYAYYIENE